jgi:hypothetical protein
LAPALATIIRLGRSDWEWQSKIYDTEPRGDITGHSWQRRNGFMTLNPGCQGSDNQRWSVILVGSASQRTPGLPGDINQGCHNKINSRIQGC